MRLAALTVTVVCAVPLLPALTDTRLAAIMGARDGGAVAARKREFLDAATVSRGRLSTGARYWVTYAVHVLGIDPIQPRGASDEIRRQYEEWLEDMAVWIVTFFPSGRFVSMDTAAKYVSEARGWYHREYGGTLGVGAGNSRLRSILTGGKRVVPQPAKRERHGCQPQALAAGLERRAVVLTPPVAAMWAAALSFGFAGLCRGCEFALDAGETFVATEHLTPHDVAFFERGGERHARVRMRRRKDLKLLTGKHHDVFLAGGGSILDPVTALERWLTVRASLGLRTDGPLFCWPDGSSITVDQVRAEVRAAMLAVGLDPQLFGAHSLRIGGASAALAAGVQPSLIRLLGRWDSSIYEIYCRMSLQSALHVGQAVTSTTVDSLEQGFHEEHFELQPSEMALLCGPADEGPPPEEEL